ncbi:hypothetical protein ACQ4PT_064040 [Festuca glaucescens]
MRTNDSGTQSKRLELSTRRRSRENDGVQGQRSVYHGHAGGLRRRSRGRPPAAVPVQGREAAAVGKWVSEIRVPGTRERLWLGSYATAEAAAVAHDAAVCLLRRGAGGLNFPGRAAAYGHVLRMAPRGAGQQLSPRSVQRVASDAGMAADAQLVELRERERVPAPPGQEVAASAGIGAPQGGAVAEEQVAFAGWGSWSSGSSSGSEQLVYGS